MRSEFGGEERDDERDAEKKGRSGVEVSRAEAFSVSVRSGQEKRVRKRVELMSR